MCWASCSSTFPTWTARWSGPHGCPSAPSERSRCGRCGPARGGRRCWTEPQPGRARRAAAIRAGAPAVSAGGLEHALREEWAAVVATLARRLGDLQAAEDAAAEAFAAAAEAWARDGVPPNPGGWLTVTAWRKAVDQLRRDRPVTVDPQVLGDVIQANSEEDEPMGAGELVDDPLGMAVARCPPALALGVRVAMALRE